MPSPTGPPIKLALEQQTRTTVRECQKALARHRLSDDFHRSSRVQHHFPSLSGHPGILRPERFAAKPDQFAKRVFGSHGRGDRFTPVLFGGVLGSLYAALQFFFAPIWGSLSDQYGRRSILLVTTLGVFGSYLLWGFAGNFILLVLARFIGGCMSGNISVATAAVADITTKENRSKGMGIVGAAFGLGFILGPALGGIFSQFNLLDSNPELARYGINPFSVVAFAASALALLNFLWVRARFSNHCRRKTVA